MGNNKAQEKDEAADNTTDPDITDPGTDGADSGSGEDSSGSGSLI